MNQRINSKGIWLVFLELYDFSSQEVREQRKIPKSLDGYSQQLIYPR